MPEFTLENVIISTCAAFVLYMMYHKVRMSIREKNAPITLRQPLDPKVDVLYQALGTDIEDDPMFGIDEIWTDDSGNIHVNFKDQTLHFTKEEFKETVFVMDSVLQKLMTADGSSDTTT